MDELTSPDNRTLDYHSGFGRHGGFVGSEWRFIAVIATATALHSLLTVDFSLAPAEDAAMLMRYAKHVADGHGIVWNVGEPPIDGATDFLFMIAIAAIMKLGVALELATRGLIIAAHVATACLVYWGVRVISGVPRAIALASVAYLIVGPATVYISTYFGAPVFAACATATWVCALAIMRGGPTRKLSIAFGLLALVTGLVRPEGVLLVSLMLASIVICLGIKPSFSVVSAFVIVFGTLGLAYFLWRWNYFGHPLPNPFYKKGGGTLHFSGLKDSVFNTLKFTLPLVPFYAYGLLRSETRRRTIATALTLIGFAACFILISSEMNFAGRFQYVLLPLALLALPIPVGENVAADSGKRIGAVALGFACFAVLYFQVIGSDWKHYPDGRADVAKLFHELKDKNLRLATSEAGLLPLYSEWTSLDTWGLNDYTIASQGTITREYLAKFDPDVIAFHAYEESAAGAALPGWTDMTEILAGFAIANDYVFAASFGDTPEHTHVYYVKRALDDSTGLASRIRSVAYAWPETGKPATNFVTSLSHSGP